MLVKTTSEHPDFVGLKDLLDQELWEMYPQVLHQYVEHNILPEETPAVIYYQDEKPVAIGAFKELKGIQAVEIKRMYVHPDYRGLKLGVQILEGLESWAKALGFSKALLETGLKNFAAHKLYERTGYMRIPNYEPYIGMEESMCFEKKL